ncbi:alpha/beta hydrolase [Archangium violaceum]|uniref:alpha/beta hydrolase family protein n=1 Tax=Archangium violaceum TaxID=83451 RepID=UPI00194F0FC8|nr:alpha/beta hydrolase [Archangium violaceum]QRN99570.1 alpha/beta hydrolase [Archangium violaceum]
MQNVAKDPGQSVSNELPQTRSLPVEAFHAWEAFFTRLVFAGLDWGDATIALEGFKPGAPGKVDWRDWHDRWLKLGKDYEQSAEKALAAGHHLTARQWLLKAAAAGHFAEFMYFDNPPLKHETRMWVTRVFHRAIPYLEYPTEPLTVAYKGHALPAYFMRPATPGPHPCVILVNGLDSAKEVELFVFAQTFLARGMAVMLFDGPGQGELIGVEPLTPDFEHVVGAVLRKMRGNSGIDLNRIGIFGVSYGGYLASRAAAFHPQDIKACINLAGTFDLENYLSINPRVRTDFRFVFKQKDDEAMNLLARERLHLNDAPALTAPLLCIHGEQDNVFPFVACKRFKDWARGGFELISYPRERHVSTNYFADFIPRFGDWMAQKLGATAPLPAGARR